MTRRSLLRALPVWTLLLIVLLASADLWGPGLVNTRGGGDSPFLLQRLHQMTANLRAGVFPVRWMPDAAYGLGYPFFNHYSALPFYVAAGFNLLGLGSLTALKLTQTLGFLAAALAMYGWVYHLWRHRAAAWLAALAYTVAPFHLVNVYVRGDSLSEFYAFIFYPLILWALQRVVEDETRPFRDTASLALAYAGLILSHNISAFIFSPFALLYLLFLTGRKALREPTPALRPLAWGVAGFVLGAALSAWAWLPALLEQDAVQSGTLTLGYFNYANHFRAADLVQPALFFDYSIAVTAGGPSPFAMGGPQALLAAAGLLAFITLALNRNHEPRNTKHVIRNTKHGIHPPPFSSLIYPLLGLLLATLMITPLSRPLWDHVPLLAMVQFPWRFLSVQALFAAVVTAGLVLRLRGGRAWGAAAGIAALLAASTLLPLEPERLLIGPQDVTTLRLQEYELFTGNIGTTIRHEWLPEAAVPRPFTSAAVIAPDAPPRPIPLTGTLLRATQTERRPTGRMWQIQAGAGGATLAFPLLYWPGWRAEVDGASTPVSAVEGAGYLALAVPPGEHTVRLALGRTPVRAAAELLSLAAGLLLLLAAARHLRRPKHFVSRITYHASRITYHASRITYHASRITHQIVPSLSKNALPLLLGLLLLASRSSPPPPRPDDLTMDFVAVPYLHHNPGGVPFDDGTRLMSYDLSAGRLAPGETLTVALNWDGAASLADGRRVSLRLVSPAEHIPDLDSGPYVLAESSLPLAVTTVHRLTLPEDAPPGVYLLQLRLWGAEGERSARTPSGQGRGPLHLRPVRVTEGAPVPPDAPVLALLGPDIRLHAAQLAAEGPNLTARLEWSTVRRLASNYGISLRLLDPEGGLRAQRDTQPGYGFAPTSLWPPGERIRDRYNLAPPDDVPPGEGYRLLVLFYRFPSKAEVARVTLGPFALPLTSPVIFEPPPRAFELPSLLNALDVDYGEQIRLAGYELQRQPERLDLTLWWVARRRPQTDYTVFVHLFDPAGGNNVTQHDAMPRRGTYPTSGWLPGEVVSETVTLDLRAVPPGDYRLGVGLYDLATADRLPATAPNGSLIPDDRLVLPIEIEIEGPGE